MATTIYKTVIKRAATLEGKKVEVSEGNIREVVGIVAELITEPEVLAELLRIGLQRKARRLKKR